MQASLLTEASVGVRMTGAVVWFTGLPPSGKTTLAHAVAEHLAKACIGHCLLDGDEMRQILAPKLGYSIEERGQFYATLARLAGALARQVLAVLVPAMAHRRAYRHYARQQAPRFLEVWLPTPLEECQRRDSKGFYESATKETRPPARCRLGLRASRGRRRWWLRASPTTAPSNASSASCAEIPEHAKQREPHWGPA
jgi:adenylylsulfate kinase